MLRLLFWQNYRILNLIYSFNPRQATTAAASLCPFFLGVSDLTAVNLCLKSFISSTLEISLYLSVNSLISALSFLSCYRSLLFLLFDSYFDGTTLIYSWKITLTCSHSRQQYSDPTFSRTLLPQSMHFQQSEATLLIIWR